MVLWGGQQRGRGRRPGVTWGPRECGVRRGTLLWWSYSVMWAGGGYRIRGKGSTWRQEPVSNLFRNVPFLTSLEVSPFLLICCCRWGVRRSEALRRGLCGAFRAKRRRTPQRVVTLAIPSISAPSFSAHNLATMDDPSRTYSLPA